MLLTRHRQRPRPRQPTKGLTRRRPLLPSRPTITKPLRRRRRRRPAGLPIGRGPLVMTRQLIRRQRPRPPTLRPGPRPPRRPQRRRRHQPNPRQANQGQQPNKPAAHNNSLRITTLSIDAKDLTRHPHSSSQRHDATPPPAGPGGCEPAGRTGGWTETSRVRRRSPPTHAVPRTGSRGPKPVT